MSELQPNLGQKRKRKTRVKRSESAVEAIKNMILDGIFEPGEPLAEEHIAEMLGMSRTPVREAINQLANEGLLKIIPGRGAVVAEITIGDFREINDLRLVLEPLAMETAIKNMPDEEIENQKKIWEHFLSQLQKGELISSTAVSNADLQLHSIMISYCDNSRLKDFLAILKCQTYQYVLHCWKSQQFVEATIMQHLEIIESLKERNIEKLKEALQKHIIFNNSHFLEGIV